MTPDDLHHLSSWGYHDDIRYVHYDFKGFEAIDFTRWYRRKQRLFTKKLFAIWLEERLIGFVTLKTINWITGQAYTGIVFDPNYMGLGYGTLGMKAFLSYVFNMYPLKRICLKVADFNRRAYKSYTKVGFYPVKTQREPFEEQQYPFELIMAEPSFEMRGNVLMTYVHTLCIDRDVFLGHDLGHANVKES